MLRLGIVQGMGQVLVIMLCMCVSVYVCWLDVATISSERVFGVRADAVFANNESLYKCRNVRILSLVKLWTGETRGYACVGCDFRKR